MSVDPVDGSAVASHPLHSPIVRLLWTVIIQAGLDKEFEDITCSNAKIALGSMKLSRFR